MRGLIIASLAVTGMAAPALSMASERETSSAEEAEVDMDQIVCRRENVIGSRVQSRRVCKSRREWTRDRDTTRDSWNELIRRGRGAPDISG